MSKAFDKFLKSLLSLKVLMWVVSIGLLKIHLLSANDYVIISLGVIGIRSMDNYITSKVQNGE